MLRSLRTRLSSSRLSGGADWPVIGVIAMVSAFMLVGHEVAVSNAIMIDEYAHVPAGVSYWDLGRFYIYRENPPLVQALAALPVWLSGARMDYSQAHPQRRSEWNVGIDFAKANPADSWRYVIRARSIITLLAIACGVLIYRWSRELYGGRAGLVCAALWFLDPTVMAFSTVVTSDVGAAAFACLAAYVFRHFLSDPSWKRAIFAGVALGLALGSKFSLLVLFPAWVIQAYLVRGIAWPQAQDVSRRGRPFWLRLAALLGIGILTLNAFYQFDGTGIPLRSYAFESRALCSLSTRDGDTSRPGNRFRETILGDLPVPHPRGLSPRPRRSEVGRGGRLSPAERREA